MNAGISRAVLRAALGFFCLASTAVIAQTSPSDLTELRPDAQTVVVKQGDVEITLGDVDTWLLEVPEKDRSGFIRSPKRIENMLFQLLLMKQTNVQARAEKRDQQPMIARHMQMAAERTLARYQTESMRAAIKSPDLSDLAKERYMSNPEAYRAPDIATAVHLLITEKERGSDAAKKLIVKLHKQASKKPAALEDLAAKYSEDPSAASNRGQLKNVSLSDLDLEFAKATRALQPGQLSAPVKSQFGWHIIRLDAIKRGRLPEFDELKDTLIRAAEQEYIERTFRAQLEGLRQRSMEPNAKVLEQLPFRYGGDADASLSAPAPEPSASK